MSIKSPDKQLLWSYQASDLLKKLGGEHTFQPPPRNLHYAMEIGHAIVATEPHDNLAGFVKMTPWTVDTHDISPIKKSKMAELPADFEDIHIGKTVPVCVEIGSLVVEASKQGNNLGKALVNHMVTMSEKAYPGLKKMAVVTNDNIASLHVFHALEWQVKTKEEAMQELGTDILDGWDPPSTLFMYKGTQADIN